MIENIQLTLTKEEQKAIASLKRLAKRFPKSLELLGWSGTLVVLKNDKEGRSCQVADIPGVVCEGCDPGYCHSLDPDRYDCGDIMDDDLVDIILE